MKWALLAGRICYSLIFINSGIFAHLVGYSGSVGYARSTGTPLAGVLVPLGGIVAIAGGLSILLGYKAKIGGWLIAGFLFFTTLFMHRFWSVSDSGMHMMQMTQFMKNLSMFGGALAFAYFGSGPLSIDKSA